MSHSKFREFAEDFVKIVNEESSNIDAIERIEYELNVYYEDVANEPDNKELRQRKNITDKWENLGFLDGLKGHVKPEIAVLYESYPSSVLLMSDGSISGKTYLD
jgi:hypothetical protein